MFLRWFVDQDGFEHARERQRELADGSVTGAMIGFAPVEVAGVLRQKGLLAGRLTPGEFAGAVRVIGDIGVAVYETTADRLEHAALLPAGRMIGMYDALFVHLAEELELPLLLTCGTRLSRAAGLTVRVEVLRGIGSG